MSRRSTDRSIGGSFVFHKLEMRESPAWRHLPDHARRVLDRLEVEHMRHGGFENGRLICTFSDFEAADVPRNAVARAIRQAEALGFIRIERGRRSAAQFRAPSLYHLTYVKSAGRNPRPPTNEWQAFVTDEQALAALRMADAPRRQAQPMMRVRAA